MRVLEIGGGPGTLWQENRHRLPEAVQVIFTDQSTGMITQARATLSVRPPWPSESVRPPGPSTGDLRPFRFGVADAQALPFATASFDVVIANHMLYHVPDRGMALAEIRRVLKPAGTFFAATNDHVHMQELRDVAERFLPDSSHLRSANERFPFDVATSELSRHFGQVQLHRYHNNLVVTDADALADYMLSGLTFTLPDGAEASFRQWLQQRILSEGSITITPAVGLFEAATAPE
jgi:SAM-dependent methyltransferase